MTVAVAADAVVPVGDGVHVFVAVGDGLGVAEGLEVGEPVAVGELVGVMSFIALSS